MHAQTEILNFVKEWFRSASEEEAAKGISARIVAEATGTWQNDVASVLNRLCEKRLLVRKGSRPIRYFLPEQETETAASALTGGSRRNPSGAAEAPAFSCIIGHNGSLALQTQLAKAGASYPPNGMHLLIVGKSGVGKTLMAEEIWHYMNEIRPPKTPQKPYVVFNCAEYSENPQLLLSQLFGYEKGAYTGAAESHEGLVEVADGGVLLLDEIHRLPPTGQEMLFTLLDSGRFRRLGSSVDRFAGLMVIGATTESPDAVLLQTFRRRIPMIIEIPPLSERPIKERVELIFHFLTMEARRLSLPIKVTPHALALLVSYDSETNIGDLKNEIQLCCARGYLTYRGRLEDGSRPDAIEFRSSNLSRHLQQFEVPEEVKNYLRMTSYNLTVFPDGENNVTDGEIEASDISTFIEDRMQTYIEENRAPEEISQMLPHDMQSHLSYLTVGTIAKNGVKVFDSVTAGVMSVTTRLLRMASEKFHYEYPDAIRLALATYLQQIKFQATVNQAHTNPEIGLIAGSIAEQKRFIRSVIPMLNEALDVSLTDDEITLIAFLINPQSDRAVHDRVGLIIMGHGQTTASSIADFTNQILYTKTAHAVDIALSMTPEKVLDELCRIVRLIDVGKGVIILTDTDNLEFYEKNIQEQTGIYCRMMPGMSTAMALELSKCILTTEDDLDTIFRRCIDAYQQHTQSLLRRIDHTRPAQIQPQERNVILTSCISGSGSACRIREYLLQFPAIYMNTEVVPIGMLDDVHAIAERYGSRLKLIIGFIDPRIDGVPFISMEKAASQEGINRITMLLQGWNSSELESHWSQEDAPLHVRFTQLSARLDYFAPSINSATAADAADEVVRNIRGLCSTQLPDDLQVRMYIHIVTMFERLHTEAPLPMPEDGTGLLDRYHDFFLQIKGILKAACRKVGVTFQETEAYYFLLTLPMDEMMQTPGDMA